MNRWAAVKSGATRREARRSYADGAKLKGMTVAQDRAAATRSSTARRDARRHKGHLPQFLLPTLQLLLQSVSADARIESVSWHPIEKE